MRRLSPLLFFSLFFTLSSVSADFRDCLPLGPKQPIYPTGEMLKDYVQDDKNNNIRYVNPLYRDQLKLPIQDGRFVPKADDGSGEGAVTLLYGMDAKGDFHFINGDLTGRNDRIRHSTLFAGGPGACFGMIMLSNKKGSPTFGKVEVITSASGHYEPTPEQLLAALDSLYRKGFDLSETLISYGGNKFEFALGVQEYSRTPAVRHLFSTPESRRCIEEKMRRTPAKEVSARDFADYYGATREEYYRFISDLEKSGRLLEYSGALASFLERNVKARRGASSSVLKALGVKLQLSDRCVRLLGYADDIN